MKGRPIDSTLVAALLAIGSDLHLRQTLQRIVVAAREVTGAKYGALGVISTTSNERRLSEFVTDGMTEAQVARIAHLPEGHGLLGLLIDHPEPIRIPHISAHAATSGFPASHPHMESFLGVPILIRNQVYGNLYLTDKADGEFTEEDQQNATVLATAAGIAINNARLYESARIREKRLDAYAEITTAVLSSADTEEVLNIVAQRALELVESDLVLIFLPQPEGLMVAEIGAGEVGGKLLAPAREDGVVVNVAQSEESHITDDLVSDMKFGQTNFTDVGPAMVIPMTAGGRNLGVLFIANLVGGRGFSHEDRLAAETLAGQAAFALILAEGNQDRGRLLVLEERDRIARDLHDLVIQRIFATGLMLQGISRLTPSQQEVQDRLSTAMEQLDETIREVRATITDLHDPSAMRPLDLQMRISHEVSASTTLLGFIPELHVSGDLDAITSMEVVEQIVAITREALTNAAKHSGGRSLQVNVEATDAVLNLSVIDDGVGMPDEIERRSGIRNIEMRANRLKGECYIGNRRDGKRGVEISLRIPLN